MITTEGNLNSPMGGRRLLVTGELKITPALDRVPEDYIHTEDFIPTLAITQEADETVEFIDGQIVVTGENYSKVQPGWNIGNEELGPQEFNAVALSDYVTELIRQVSAQHRAIDGTLNIIRDEANGRWRIRITTDLDKNDYRIHLEQPVYKWPNGEEEPIK